MEAESNSYMQLSSKMVRIIYARDTRRNDK